MARRVQQIALITAAAALASIAAAPGASASTIHPQMCPTETNTTVSNAATSFIADSGKRVYGARGVTLSLSIASGHTWTGSVTGTGSVSESAIVASAVQSIAIGISYAKTTTVTLGGSWTVPSTQASGWLALGSMGYTMKWTTTAVQGNCTNKTIGQGSAALPRLSPFINHS